MLATPFNKSMIRQGMTLIEIMIVVTIMVAIMGVAGYGLGFIGAADVNGEALRLSSLVRYTFNMAATTNQTLQMQLDFDARKFTVEKLELSGGLSDDELRGTTIQSSKAEKNTRERISRSSRMDAEDSKFGQVTRTGIEDDVFINAEDSQLEDGVYFIGLMTSHHDEMQKEGIGTINFFANGFVERSVIILGNEAALTEEENAIYYTISISPLTGQSTVTAGKMEISSSFFEEEEDN